MTAIPSDQQLQHLLELAQDAEQVAHQMSDRATHVADKWEEKLQSAETERERSHSL